MLAPDANRDFIYLSIKCPGSEHDNHAFGMSDLSKRLHKGALQLPFFIIADAAYKGASRVRLSAHARAHVPVCPAVSLCLCVSLRA